MARKKVNLQWIANASTQRATFKKRCNALMKKTSELATLCGVKACVVAYIVGETKPEVCPSIPEARQLLNRFKAMPNHLENLKKVLSQEEYLRSRISKLHEQVCKSNNQSREHETSKLLYKTMVGSHSDLANLTNEELTSLNWMVERKMRSIKERFQQLAIEQGSLHEPLCSLAQQPVLSSSQLQAPYTNNEVQTLVATEEPQPQHLNWLADLAQSGGKLGADVRSDFAGSSGGVGLNGNGGDVIRPQNIEGLGFPWSWDPFPSME